AVSAMGAYDRGHRRRLRDPHTLARRSLTAADRDDPSRLPGFPALDGAAVSPIPPMLPDLPRLPAPLPRSGVSSEARIALRQILGDVERATTTAFHAGADVGGLLRYRARAVERVVLHAWLACLGETGDCTLLAVGGFGRGQL